MSDERIVSEQPIVNIDRSSEIFGHFSISRRSLTPSPDGRRVAYVDHAVSTGDRPRWGSSAVMRGDQRVVVVDGIEEKQHYDGIADDSLCFSPDSQRVAYVAESHGYMRPLLDGGPVDAKAFVVVDGKEEKQYDEIAQGSLCFSPNSQRAAYVARVGNTLFVVIDGKERGTTPLSGNYGGEPSIKEAIFWAQRKWSEGGVVFPLPISPFAPAPVIFSPDSQRVAYAVSLGGREAAVVDGREEKVYTGILQGSLCFSPDSRRVAYAAGVAKKWLVVVDGREEKQYDEIAQGSLCFSPDSQRVAYVAGVGNIVSPSTTYDVDEGAPESDLEFIEECLSTGTAQRFCTTCGAMRVSQHHRFCRHCGAPYNGIQEALPEEDPINQAQRDMDQQQEAEPVSQPTTREQLDELVRQYNLQRELSARQSGFDGALNGNRRFVVVDGKEEKHYEGYLENSLCFSPDSQRVAYVAYVGDEKFVVVDGNEEKHYDEIAYGSLFFSPDNRRVAYVAYVGDKKFVVVDGREEKQYDGILLGSPCFSPDSRHLAYAAVSWTHGVGNKWFVVVDGREEKQYDGMLLGSLCFSPDSRRLAYAARVGDKSLVVLDGKEGKKYEEIWMGKEGIIFDPPHRLLYIAINSRALCLVEERIN